LPDKFWKKRIEVITLETWSTKLKDWEEKMSSKFALFPGKKKN
jgi:hypothetical protein